MSQRPPHDDDDDGNALPDPLSDLLDQSWKTLEEGDVVGARAGLDVYLLGHPGEGENPDVLLFLAACAGAEDRVDEALGHLRTALKHEPEWPAAHLAMAETLERFPDRLKEAHKHAAKAVALADDEDEFLDAVFLKARIEMQREEPDAARATLDELPPAKALAHEPDIAIDVAELRLALEDFDEVEELARAVLKHDPQSPLAADAHYLIGLVAEERGDDLARVAAWVKVRALDDGMAAGEIELTEDDVVQVAEAALAELPARAQTLLRDIPILVADLPPASEVEQGFDPRALGMFAGIPHNEDSALGTGPGLRQIFLFRRNLDRLASDPEVLAEEIRTTLLHETGHFFGLDEEALANLGLN